MARMITYKQGGAVVGGGIRPCVFADFTVYEREKGGGRKLGFVGWKWRWKMGDDVGFLEGMRAGYVV